MPVILAFHWLIVFMFGCQTPILRSDWWKSVMFTAGCVTRRLRISDISDVFWMIIFTCHDKLLKLFLNSRLQ